MPTMQSVTRAAILPGVLALVAAFSGSEPASAQGGGPAAYYDPSYTNSVWNQIFESHRSWGNAVPGAEPSPNGYWCVHPDHLPGQLLTLTANGITITCTVGDTVNPAHEAQWRSQWAVELSWSAFVALDLNRRNFVDSVQPGGVGGDGVGIASADPEAPSTRYYPETGHTVGHGFLDYWRANGGLEVFGYPLSDEIEENGVTVQYFERAVFEFYPENPPEHRVLLRLLGVHASTGMIEIEPFQPLGEADAGGGRYFPQTGQSIANRFNGFWESHGGLQNFGYPISRPFEQNGMFVQYFERAVFEWHPDNPHGYQVLLRHLGAQAYGLAHH